MTLLGVKPSTKDVYFMAPDLKEYDYLIRNLKKLDYAPVTQSSWQRPGEQFQFDIFRGNNIHTTGLLTSPLEEGRHTIFKEYSYLYIGILNDYDLISSKLMRGTRVDFDDCLALTEAHIADINIDRLIEHFNEMVSYDVSQDRLRPHITHFVELLKEKGLYEQQ